eukprot:3922619-Pleurochrysis_carterae.AAC.1
MHNLAEARALRISLYILRAVAVGAMPDPHIAKAWCLAIHLFRTAHHIGVMSTHTTCTNAYTPAPHVYGNCRTSLLMPARHPSRAAASADAKHARKRTPPG